MLNENEFKKRLSDVNNNPEEYEILKSVSADKIQKEIKDIY